MGKGLESIKQSLESILSQTHGSLALYVEYNEPLSHKVYAGTDFMLIPSRTEPCGLTQMYSARYGAIPLVRTVGGLYDTVPDYEDNGGFGIRFIHNNVHDVAHAIGRAIHLYQNTQKKALIQKRMMKIDFSWNKSVKQYRTLYTNLIRQVS